MAIEEDDDRTMLFGLLIECPFKECTEVCPLKEKRESLSLKEKAEYVESLSDEEIEKILDYHRECLKLREQ